MYLIGIDPSTSLNGFYPIARIIVNFTQLIHSELLSGRNEYDSDLDTFFETNIDNEPLFDSSYDSYIESLLDEIN